MEAKLTNLDNQAVGTIQLSDEVFGVDPRVDLLQRMVVYQLARRQQGTHKTKTYGEVSASTKKIVRQKGSGGARHGGRGAPQFRGGGKAFGPVVRSHASDLPKKVRKLALKVALSAKAREGKLIVIDELKLGEGRTRVLAQKLGGLGLNSVLFIGGNELDLNFARAAQNLPHVDVLPQQGANVYDILRREVLVLSKDAVETLEARLK